LRYTPLFIVGLAALGAGDAYHQGVRQAECTFVTCPQERWVQPHGEEGPRPTNPLPLAQSLTVINSTGTATALSRPWVGSDLWRST
jgi:hypothetical protein